MGHAHVIGGHHTHLVFIEFNLTLAILTHHVRGHTRNPAHRAAAIGAFGLLGTAFELACTVFDLLQITGVLQTQSVERHTFADKHLWLVFVLSVVQGHEHIATATIDHASGFLLRHQIRQLTLSRKTSAIHFAHIRRRIFLRPIGKECAADFHVGIFGNVANLGLGFQARKHKAVGRLRQPCAAAIGHQCMPFTPATAVVLHLQATD